eukprot:4328042-Prymnesium_polylepis.2
MRDADSRRNPKMPRRKGAASRGGCAAARRAHLQRIVERHAGGACDGGDDGDRHRLEAGDVALHAAPSHDRGGTRQQQRPARMRGAHARRSPAARWACGGSRARARACGCVSARSPVEGVGQEEMRRRGRVAMGSHERGAERKRDGDDIGEGGDEGRWLRHGHAAAAGGKAAVGVAGHMGSVSGQGTARGVCAGQGGDAQARVHAHAEQRARRRAAGGVRRGAEGRGQLAVGTAARAWALGTKRWRAARRTPAANARVCSAGGRTTWLHLRTSRFMADQKKAAPTGIATVVAGHSLARASLRRAVPRERQGRSHAGSCGGRRSWQRVSLLQGRRLRFVDEQGADRAQHHLQRPRARNRLVEQHGREHGEDERRERHHGHDDVADGQARLHARAHEAASAVGRDGGGKRKEKGGVGLRA